ncbi:hypothetical protein XA68_17404 [Ophiocordyceps unilateralis]|uniref:Uncharacterized protein n=1 Tax=Ophiocordyceps unilateralis TaxID=268505 RepID=A0A2A9PJ94_OPHUN|nr:hypothetical protein XA68_17404 [Ophiocordyceps unilateralis]
MPSTYLLYLPTQRQLSSPSRLNPPVSIPPKPQLYSKMSDDDGQELVTKPFKFVTVGKPMTPSTGRSQHGDASSPMPPNTAGKTTSTTTSASTPRERTLSLAISSGLPTDQCALRVGTNAGTNSEREETFP